MNQYFAIFNIKTLIAVLISIASLIIAFQFNINYNIDLTIISIAIVFPLVFSIRTSFRRREKALEHLSQFRSSLKTIDYFFKSALKLPGEKQHQIEANLIKISDTVVAHLGNKDYETKELDATINTVNIFITENVEYLPKGLKEKIIRFLNDLHNSVDNLHAIHSHRTPISLKAYCLIYIYIFPLVYIPSIIHKIGSETNMLITFFIVIVTEFFLITLYNIQDHMEHPFDQDGLDDINLSIFKINRG